MSTITTLVAAAALVLAGCASSNLEPASGANTVDSDTLVAETASVELAAALDAWPGRDEVREKVTPVRVTVVNTSAASIEVEADAFELSNDRLVFDTIDLVSYAATVNVPANTVTNPELMTPSTTVGANTAGTNWVLLELPTNEMEASALEATTLAPGESVSGFVYFGNVDSVEDGVELSLVGRFAASDEGAEQVAEIMLPVVTQ